MLPDGAQRALLGPVRASGDQCQVGRAAADALPAIGADAGLIGDELGVCSDAPTSVAVSKPGRTRPSAAVDTKKPSS